jgi:hypothetical protein
VRFMAAVEEVVVMPLVRKQSLYDFFNNSASGG